MCFTISVRACQVHRWTCPWVEIQVSMIIRPHATSQRNRTTQSRAWSSQRSVYHRFLRANAPANHTWFGITLRQKHNAVAAVRIIYMGQGAGQSHLVWYYFSAEAQCNNSYSTNYYFSAKAQCSSCSTSYYSLAEAQCSSCSTSYYSSAVA